MRTVEAMCATATVIGSTALPWISCERRKPLKPLAAGAAKVALTFCSASSGVTAGMPQLPTSTCERSRLCMVRSAATCSAPSARGMICTPWLLKCAWLG